jgi:hypothetical protein
MMIVAVLSVTSVSPARPMIGGLGPGFESAAAGQAPQAPTAAPMLDAWRELAASVGTDLRERAAFSFDGDERLDWFYTPVSRTGLPIGALSESQLGDLKAFLLTGMGEMGVQQAFDIVALEEVLFAQSGGAAMRNPGNYFLGTFGEPSPDSPWGWRFEGHHLSVSFTIVDGRLVSGTPAFFGGNPARVPEDADVHPGLSPFAREQGVAHRLMSTFSGEQQSRVVIAAEAPDDILTSNDRRASMGVPEGISIADMTAEQSRALGRLLRLFLARMNPALAEYQMAKIEQAGYERVHFAWAGGTEPGDRHYFRIHGPTFVVEWDNTQGDGNHVHSVWRDFEDDFGYDPLGQHLEADHGLVMPANEVADGPAKGAVFDGDVEAHRSAHARGAPHRHEDSR